MSQLRFGILLLLSLLLLCSQYLSAPLELIPLYPLYDNSTQYLLLHHISKCSGGSLHHEALSKGIKHASFEQCYQKMLTVKNPFERNSEKTPFLVTYIRSPRDHVYSLYAECRFDMLFFKMAKKRLPKGASKILEEDFLLWLNHFQYGIWGFNGKRDDFSCYNPRNYLTRAMAGDAPGDKKWCTASITSEPRRVDTLTLNSSNRRMESAIKNIQTVDFVGETFFYSESWCMLMYRLGEQMPSTCGMCDAQGPQRNRVLMPTENKYLTGEVIMGPNNVTIDTRTLNKIITQGVLEEGSSKDGHFHYSHGVPKINVNDFRQQAVFDAIDNITQADRQLYIEGLKQWCNEITFLKQVTGKQLLCWTKVLTFLDSNRYLSSELVKIPCFDIKSR